MPTTAARMQINTLSFGYYTIGKAEQEKAPSKAPRPRQPRARLAKTKAGHS